MDGVTLLQAIPGSINIFLLIVCIIAGIFALIFIIEIVAALIKGKDNEVPSLLLAIVITLIISILWGFAAHEYRLKPENCYYYATIDDNVIMNDFFQHYILIKHEDDSSIWIIKEKTNNLEEN